MRAAALAMVSCSLVILAAGCGRGAPPEGEAERSPVGRASPVPITGPTHLLDLLERAVWEPSVVNLNNPAIAAMQADLGDGPVPVLYAHPPASLTWFVRLMRPTNLVTAIGLRKEAWDKTGDGVGFQVFVDDARPQMLFEGWIDPRHHPQERPWKPLVLDLSPWTGQAVRLILRTDPGPDQDPSYDWAVFRDPQLRPR